MKNIQPYRIKTISEYHQIKGLPKPEHPLVSVIYLDETQQLTATQKTWVFDFYSIALKRNFDSKVKYKYGQQTYDFDEGVMFFGAPGQVLKIQPNGNSTAKRSGWMLLVHTDFFWNTALAKTIKQYEFFGYSVNEALWLSKKEEATVNNIIQNIQQEYHSNIDKFSKQIIISHIEALLNYSDRFYNRQFITRDKSSHQIIERLEELLTEHFNRENLVTKGLPTVQNIAQALNLSPGYLRSLLKVLTGQNTQQHIHNKLIEKAKEKLSTSDMSISEIAYQLGFEHLQSFSKLFKTKTNLSPLEFRQSFN